jgi:hypothetical protein
VTTVRVPGAELYVERAGSGPPPYDGSHASVFQDPTAWPDALSFLQED